MQFHGSALAKVAIEEGVRDLFPVIQGHNPQHTGFSVQGVENRVANTEFDRPIVSRATSAQILRLRIIRALYMVASAKPAHRNTGSSSCRLTLRAPLLG
jgi:hypothetical protein